MITIHVYMYMMYMILYDPFWIVAGHGGRGDLGGPGDASEVRAHHAAQAPGRAAVAEVAAVAGAEVAAAAAPGGGAAATEEQRGSCGSGGRPWCHDAMMPWSCEWCHEISMKCGMIIMIFSNFWKFWSEICDFMRFHEILEGWNRSETG